MGALDLLRRFRLDHAAASPPPGGRVLTTFTLGGTYPWDQRLALGLLAPKISRDEALQVPAVMRGRNLICALATLPLYTHDGERNRVRTPLLEQIDPNVPNVVTLAQTIEDLIFESTSWWKVETFGFDGFPTKARHTDHDAVSMSPPPGFPIHSLPSGLFPRGVVWVSGEPVDASSMIRFDSPNPPLLKHAARAIRRAAKLEQAVDRYADSPQATGHFAPVEGADPADDDEIEELLTDYEAARRRHSTGYVPAALKWERTEWSPAELRLYDAIARATLAIVNAMGLDPEDFGINTTSRVYQNAVDRRQDKLNETLAAYMCAITDRLSMGDVTPRGKYVRFRLDEYLRADPKTRWETYAIGHGLDAITDDEIREAEQLPDLTPTQRLEIEQRRAARAPAPAIPPAPEPAQLHAGEPATFAGELGDPVYIEATADQLATFAVDFERRTISGMALPYGPIGTSGGRRYRFQQGSVYWEGEVGRVKHLEDHDRASARGRAIALDDTPAGLRFVSKIAPGPEGDRLLQLADPENGVKDGLSVGVAIHTVTPDPENPGVLLVAVRGARLYEITSTAMPEFDDARVDAVAASLDPEGITTMTTAPPAPPAPAAPAPPPAPAPSPAAGVDLSTFTAAFQAGVADAIAAGVQQAFERLTEPQGGREPVIPRVQVTYEPPIYTLIQQAGGHSFIRDAWRAHTSRDQGAVEAAERLQKFERQQAEIQTRLAQHFPAGGVLSQFGMYSQLLQQFATGTTANLPQIIPPGYRPELYVPQLFQQRPLNDSLSQGQISDATPFTVPKFLTGTGLAAAHVEGTNPTDGTITTGTVTVTPGAKSGLFKVTREIVDASNPAIDAIATAAMREAYSQVCEAVVYAELNGANGVGGTITGENVPSGAYAYTSTGAGAPAAGLALLRKYRETAAKYPFRRFAPLNRIVLSQEGTVGFATAEDSTGRPLLPPLNPSNAYGVTQGLGTPQQGFNVDGIAALPAWSMTGNAAGDADLIGFNAADAWAWESPTLLFRFEERSGPALIELALFGYYACRILRAAGFFGIRGTQT